MEEKEFSALVESLEGYAREHPGAYKLRVALLAALGYAFLIGVVIAIGVFAVTVIYFGRLNWIIIKVLAIPLGIAALVLRSLWVVSTTNSGPRFSSARVARLRRGRNRSTRC
ncbi:MAG TPA: hypothetical protein VHQ94_20185 [Pyrinomonadaceae bacterium]|nr:hypothetical protein [Pyrinomonadaceae bacterium]